MLSLQRYLFQQLLVPTLAATAALGSVAVLSQSLQLLSIVISQRQEAWLFLELVLLTVPYLVALVLPITAFVATLFTINKLHTEQEIVVCFAAGMSRWQVASPAMRLSAWAALVMLVVSLWVAPWCGRIAREELFKARTDLVGSLIKEGQFTESPGGLTAYAQRIDAEGRLHNLFIHQLHPDKSSATYDAKTGVIMRKNGVPYLVMRDGSNEQFSATGALNYLRFAEYTLDLSPYADTSDTLGYKPSDMYMHELMFPDRAANIPKNTRRKMTSEWNSRLTAPLYIPLFVFLALQAVVGGAFSRLGYARRIGAVALGALLIRLVGVTVQAACDGATGLNVLQWAIPLIALWFVVRAFLRTQRPATQGAPLGGGGLKPLGAPA